MEFDLAALIDKFGVQVALLLYFAYKDFKFTAQIVELMTEVKNGLRQRNESDGRKGESV